MISSIEVSSPGCTYGLEGKCTEYEHVGIQVSHLCLMLIANSKICGIARFP